MLKKRLYFMLGMVALLVFAAFLPTIVTVAEDHSLKKESKTMTIESVDITPKDSNFYNLLQEFPMMLNNMMYVGNLKSMTQDQVFEVEKEFLQTIGLEIVYDNLKYREESVYLTTSSDYETVYFVWQCTLADEFGMEYQVWIDDEAQKVLGFVVENYIETIVMTHDGQAQYAVDPLQQMADSMAEYYDFASGEVVYSKPYGGEVIVFYDSDGKERMMLSISSEGNYLQCNLIEMPSYSVDGMLSEEDKMQLSK